MTFFSRVFLPFALLCYVTIETYLKLQHTSLCGSEGCKLAGELLRFDPIYLNYLGIGAVTLLLLTGWASLQSKIMERLFFIILYTAIAFETTIIGYQFIVNPEPCLFCFSVFSSLLLIAFLSYPKRFAAVISVVLAIYLGLNILDIGKNKSYTVNDGVYLIHSESCPHCQKVKDYFKTENIAYEGISVRDVNARHFLKFIDISSIPVVLIKKKQNIQLIHGDKSIIAHFQTEQNTNEEMPAMTQSSSAAMPSDLFSATDEPGCAISITQTPSCEKNNTEQ